MRWTIFAGSLASILAGDQDFAQNTTIPAVLKPSTTMAHQEQLMNKLVLSSDNKSLGTVAAVVRTLDGNVTKIDADVGEFLGISHHRISLTSAQFTVEADDVKLVMTAEQARAAAPIAK